ncbi:alpha/beta hydrolase [Rhodobacteraceae bacterium ASV31]|nr:alpha/beta hydrolase [Anianabacter salinae]
MEPLARRLGEPALAPDFLDHGDSPDADPAADYQTACLNAVAAGLDGPHDIVGHSFGATVALRLAVERPDLVRRLVLIEPVFFAAARDHANYAAMMAWSTAFDAHFAAGDVTAAARSFTEVWGGSTPWDRLPEAQRAAFTDRIHVIPAMDGPVKHDSARLLAPGRLESVRCQTLMIAGGASPPIIPAIQDALALRLPHASRVTIDGAGHMLPLTHAGAAADVIGRFLA